MTRRELEAAAATTGETGEGDALLTAGEVAALLRVTPAWIYTATRRNEVPHVRLGRYVRYRRSAIEEWIAEIEDGPHGA